MQLKAQNLTRLFPKPTFNMLIFCRFQNKNLHLKIVQENFLTFEWKFLKFDIFK
jgi:hypothetical protein